MAGGSRLVMNIGTGHIFLRMAGQGQDKRVSWNTVDSLVKCSRLWPTLSGEYKLEKPHE